MDMTPIGNILGGFSDKINWAKDGDYMDGETLMCGKCKTPKSYIPKSMNMKIVVPIKCECEKEEIRLEEEKAQKEKKLRKIEEFKKYSLIEDNLVGATFSNTEVTRYNARQLKIAKRYVELFPEMKAKAQGLLFYGDVGTGKSRIATVIGNELIERLHTFVSTSLVKLLQESKYGKIDEDVIEALCTAELVLIDDLGAEKGTESAKEIVYYVIDCRIRSNKPMIVTTNLSLEEMKQDTDIKNKRVYDRIIEHCYLVEFKGPSYRMKEALRRNDEMKKLLEGE